MDNFWKVFGDSVDDPFKLMLGGIRANEGFSKVFVGQMTSREE